MLPTGSLGTDRRFDGADSNTRSRERQGDEALCDPSRPIYICRLSERQVFDGGSDRMCVKYRAVAVLGTILACVLASLQAAPRPGGPADPLLPLLQNGDPKSRADALALLKDLGSPPCRILGGYASDPRSRVRERAVRIMADAGCAQFAAHQIGRA